MLPILNIVAFALVTGYALYLFGHLVYSRVVFIRLGKSHQLERNAKARLNEFLVNVFGQKKLLKDKKSGMMHVVMFYGFIVLQLGALELLIKGVVKGFAYPLGPLHGFYVFTQELTALLVLLAVGFAFYRRYIEKLKRLKRGLKSGLVLIFLTALMLSLLLSLSFEQLWLGHEAGAAAPLASAIAGLFAGLDSQTAGALFYVFWWVHLLTLLTFLVYVPQSKHAHLLFAPVNVLLRDTKPAGKLTSLDLEDETAESFGVGKIEEFRQNQLIDLYACVECGRCTNMCPASGTGKTLSPMDLIVKMRDHLTERGAAITSRTPWLPAFAFPSAPAEGQAEQAVRLVGDVITEEELWACTTCRNCEDQCPVANEHVEKIVDMRRYLVLTEGHTPPEAVRYFQNVERQSNPWGINRNERVKWREGREDLRVPTVLEAESFEYLFFVGSMGSFDARSQKIAQAFAKIMNAAGVSFAILGNEERNSGDTARRMGNELLFQQLCQENIATFQAYGVKKIVTICPHTYNTFKHEYPEFGLEAEVYHHTELIWQFIQDGRIKPAKAVKEAVAYHDSCYIGRYNGIYDIPRRILQSIPGVDVLEMARGKQDAMCCGAGGGMMWMEETQGKRVNVERTEQALALQPTAIGSNCPYCLTMMSDGVKAKEAEARVQTLDIAEIVEKSIA